MEQINKHQELFGVAKLSMLVLIGMFFGVLLNLNLVSSAICVADIGEISIISEGIYGIGRDIKNITIFVNPNEGGISDIPVLILLLESDETNDNEWIAKVDTYTDLDGKVRINCDEPSTCFNYRPNEEDELKIKVIVGADLTGGVTTEFISILPTLRLVLNCPAQGVINRDIECSWRSLDERKPLGSQRVDAGSFKEITIGLKEVKDITSLGKDGLKFKVNSTGEVIVKVRVESDGFIGDEKKAKIDLEHPTRSSDFLIDNKDFFLVNTIEIGTRNLKIVVEESGEDVEVKGIISTIRIPSGNRIPLEFNEAIDGWKTTFNFEQAGQTYYLEGRIEFKDLTKDDLLFDYNIVTSSGITAGSRTSITFIIIGVSIGILLIIVTLVLVFRNRGKKKKK